MKRFGKIAKSVVSVLLAVIFCSQTFYYSKAAEETVTSIAETALAAATAAAAESNLYVKEVSIGYKDDLKNSGYTVIDSANINVQPDSRAYDWPPDLYLGYKTTTNIDEAITDLTLLGTNDGFAKLDIKEQLSSEKAGVTNLVNMLKTAISEYKTNLKNGSTPAKIMETALNYLYVPAENGKSDMSLSEYITSDKVSDDEFVTLVMIGADNLEYILVNQLSLAVCDDMSKEGATSWLDRLAKTEPYAFKDSDGSVITDEGIIEDTYKTKYDTKYSARAKRLYTAIGNFVDSYKKALVRYPDGKVPQLTEAEINTVYDQISGTKSSSEESVDLNNIKVEKTDVISTSESKTVDQQKVNDAVTLSLYNALNEKNDKGEYKYSFGKKSDGSARSITGFFDELMAMDVKSDDANVLAVYRLLYPLLENQDGTRVLSDGQADILYLAGFQLMMIKGSLGRENYNDIEKKIKDAGASITDAFGGPMSVWYGVNKAAYENQKGVYYTSEAYRKEAASKIANSILKPAKTKTELTTSEKVELAIQKMDLASNVIGATVLLANCIMGLVSTITYEKAIETIGLCIAGKAAEYSLAASVACVALEVVSVASTVLVFVTMFMGLISYFIYCADKSLDYKTYDYNSIPDVVYDFDDSNIKLGAALDYYAVRYPEGDYHHDFGYEIDERIGRKRAFPYILKIDSNQKMDIDMRIIHDPDKVEHPVKMQVWLVMYYTRNKNAGAPITVAHDADGKDVTFVSKKNDYFAPDGYTGIHSFGSRYARDLTADLGKKADEVEDFDFQYYWFMHREPNKTEDETQGKYLADVCMLCYTGSQSTAAKYELEGKGYKVIEKNLTLHSDVTTYIGYKTTDLESNAVTDIRFAYNPGVNPKAGSIYYGANKYTASGSVGMLTLFITKNTENGTSTAGTPILSEGFGAYTDKSKVPEGYEPVNLFSGGPALDLNLGGSWGYENTGIPKSESKYYGDTVYLYFQPSKKYTSGTEYLGGLSFFTGIDVDSFVTEMGWTVLDDTDLSGHEYKMTNLVYGDPKKMYGDVELSLDDVKECKTVLAYTTTYNPYRAIYDIKTYTCEPTATQPNYCINYGGLGYCASDVYVNGTGTNNNVYMIDDDGKLSLVKSPDEYNELRSSVLECLVNLEQSLSGKYLTRGNRTLRYTHAYRSRVATEGGYSSQESNGYLGTMAYYKENNNYPLSYMAEIRETSDGKIIYGNITPVALYVLGCNVTDISKANPLKLSEIAVQHTTTYSGTEKNVTPVKDFTDAYGTEATDLAGAESLSDNAKFLIAVNNRYSGIDWKYYSRIFGSDQKLIYENKNSMSLFILRKDVKKGKYVQSVKVCYAGNGVKTKNEKGEDVTEKNKTPFDYCKYNLITAGPGELIRLNLASDVSIDEISKKISENQLFFANADKSIANGAMNMNYFTYDEWEEITDKKTLPNIREYYEDGKFGCQADYDDEVAYIYITYTNVASKALSDLYIASSSFDFQDDKQIADGKKSNLSSTMSLSNGAEVNVCGDGFRVNGTGDYYYIYSLSGNGDEITDIVIDSNVYIDGYTTSLSTDFNASSYRRFFIHAKHKAPLFGKTYLESAKTETADSAYNAQIKLLDAGCQRSSSRMIKHSNGEVVAFGIKQTTSSKKAISGLLLKNTEQDETVNKIIFGKDTYMRMALNLNASEVYDAITPLYSTTSVRKAHENGSKAHYVTEFMFWTSTELVECFMTEEEDVDAANAEIKENLDKYLATLSKEDADYLRSFVYTTTRDSNGKEDVHIVKWDIVRNTDDEYMNCSHGIENFVSDKAKTNEVYMYIHYTDNYVRNDDLEDEGSFFGNTGAVVSVSGALLLLLLAGAYLIVRKRKKKENLAAK